MSLLTGVRTSMGSTKVVRFQVNYDLKNLLLAFVNEKDAKHYEELVCKIRDKRDEIEDDELIQLLQEARGCISFLDRNFRLFVQVVLTLKWTHRGPEAVSEYQGFLQDLCSAHNYYTVIVIDHLVQSFRADTSNWIEGEPPEDFILTSQHAHQVILSITSLIPMSTDILIKSIQNAYPYIKKPGEEHESYVYNVLRICKYMPTIRYKILKLLITMFINQDVHTPRSEMEESDIFEMETDQPKKIGGALDLSMRVFFKYINQECMVEGQVDLNKLKSLYNDLYKIFEDVILPTHAIHHVQFIMFYLLSLKPALAMCFIQSLWSKHTDPCIPPVIRQISVCYIASLLARSKFLSIMSVQETVTEMTNWIHSYIGNHDGSKSTIFSPFLHTVFYSTCQAVFYLIAFRYKELINNKGLIYLQGLNLSKIVMCRLNPLKVCSPVITARFASVARAYQFAYCFTIIERNARSTLPQIYRDSSGAIIQVANTQLDTFFPFDPYLLPKSQHFISSQYREYTGPNETEEQSNTNEDEDDFLVNTPTTKESLLANFSYGTSPGFLQ